MGQFAAPHRQLDGIDVVEPLEGNIPDAPGKGVHKEGGTHCRFVGNAVVIHEIPVAALKQHALLKEHLHILGHQTVGAAQFLPDSRRFAYKERRVLGKIVQQGASALIEHRQVFVDVLEGQAVPELARIAEQMLLCRGRILAPELLGPGFQIIGKALRGVVEHFPGRGDHAALAVVLPALGVGLEYGNAVDLIAPELQTEGIGHVGRIEVDDAAPLGELTDAIHLISALIARSQQPGDDLLGRDGLTGGEGGAVLPEGFRGNGALERCLGRHHRHHFLTPGQGFQHPQPGKFIFPGYTLHLPEGELPGGKDHSLFLAIKAVEILCHPHGSRFVRGEHQTAAPGERPGKMHLVDLGKAGCQHGGHTLCQVPADLLK